MPNLTSYHPPALHLYRELPKTSCDLIQHEFNYLHFVRSRLARLESSLSSTNKNNCLDSISQHRVFDRHLSNVYQHHVGKCQPENDRKQRNISRFHLRQKHWKEQIEKENQRFIQTLVYHREKYRPMHDRYTAQKSFEQHLKSLKMMSQYSEYNQTNPICRKLLKNVKFDQSKKCRELKSERYSRRSNAYIENLVRQTICQAIHIYNQPLPSSYSDRQ